MVWRFIPVELGGAGRHSEMGAARRGQEEEGDSDVALGGWVSRH